MQSRIQLVPVFYVLAALYVLAQESDYFCVGRKTCIALVGTILYLAINRLDIKFSFQSEHCLGTYPTKTSLPQETFYSSCPLHFVFHTIIRLAEEFVRA